MNRQDEKRADKDLAQQEEAAPSGTPGQRQDDDSKLSYEGNLDKVEGNMNNGETGGFGNEEKSDASA